MSVLPSATFLQQEVERLQGECDRLRAEMGRRNQLGATLQFPEAPGPFLTENLPAFTFAANLGGQVHFATPQLESILGYAPNAFTGSNQSWYDLLPGPDVPRARAALGRRLARGAPFSSEIRLLARDGREIWLRCNLIPLRDELGSFHGLALDVTPQRRLSGLVHRQCAALEAASDAIAILDAGDRLIFLNRACVRALRASHASQLEGKHWSEICPQSAPFALEIKRVLEREGAWRGLIEDRAPSGATLQHDLSVTRLEDGGHLVIARDATDRLQIEDQLRARNEQLLETDRFKNTFLRTVSHELRTPLTSIMGFSELLIDELAGPISPQQRSFVAEIQHSGEILRQLIDDMLDFVRLEAGNFCLAVCEADAVALVREVVHFLAPEARSAQVSLVLECPPEPIAWTLDPRRMGQVIFNLLQNAIKFTHAGGTITVRTRASGDALEVAVHDTGIGIPDRYQERIFEKFFQIDPSQTRVRGGAGLGLAVARALVEAHEGQLAVESREGQGSVFRCTLPPGREEGPFRPQDVPDRALISWAGP